MFAGIKSAIAWLFCVCGILFLFTLLFYQSRAPQGDTCGHHETLEPMPDMPCGEGTTDAYFFQGSEVFNVPEMAPHSTFIYCLMRTAPYIVLSSPHSFCYRPDILWKEYSVKSVPWERCSSQSTAELYSNNLWTQIWRAGKSWGRL